MKTLLLGASGAVGRVIHTALVTKGHSVSSASRSKAADLQIDLSGSLTSLSALAPKYDIIVNASGSERPEVARAVGRTPFVDVSASASYLRAVKSTSSGSSLLGAGLAPGLSTVMASALSTRTGDDIDVFIMLGSGEKHGPAAVSWTAGLIGSNVYEPPENVPVPNLRSKKLWTADDGKHRTYLRADFADHHLLHDTHGISVRSYLTLSSAVMTHAFRIIARMPAFKRTLSLSPAVGSDEWHISVVNQRTGEQLSQNGNGQSHATGVLTALASENLFERARHRAVGAVTMADLVTLEEATRALGVSAEVEDVTS